MRVDRHRSTVLADLVVSQPGGRHGSRRRYARSYRHHLRTLRLETELDAAREVQRSIWPHRPPEVAGLDIAARSEPASAVGGDFFDFYWHGQGRDRLCLAVGDVVGKGMKAAMQAVLASGLLAATLETEELTLVESLHRLGRIIRQRSADRAFISLAILCLDLETLRLSYVNAGLPEPLLRSSQGTRFLATEDPRYPLGVRPSEEYRESQGQLEVGDVLVLYSDGLAESRSPRGDVYGYDALAAHLAALPASLGSQEILDALHADAARFRGSAAPQDDVTSIVVRVTATDRWPSAIRSGA